MFLLLLLDLCLSSLAVHHLRQAHQGTFEFVGAIGIISLRSQDPPPPSDTILLCRSSADKNFPRRLHSCERRHRGIFGESLDYRFA
uniref:Putative secreted protein n=1 Tax=Anopheles darlingi TaxID=43151 RepID=A0A2M4DN91_ANODA